MKPLHSREFSENTDPQYKVQAILAEYNTLRSEIQSRSDYQNRLLQLHISVLTLIMGAAISQPLGHLIVLLIPIESTIFGLWWFDNMAAIGDIAGYIRVSIEGKLGELLKDPNVMGWERRPLSSPKPIFSRKRTFITTSLVGITFAAPSIATLLITILLIIVSIPILNFQQTINALVNINPVYTGLELLAAIAIWISGFILQMIYFFRNDK